VELPDDIEEEKAEEAAEAESAELEQEEDAAPEHETAEQ